MPKDFNVNIAFPQTLQKLHKLGLLDPDASGDRKQLPQARIAKLIGVEPSTMSQIINGKSRPSMEVLVKLAKVYGVSIDYLVTGKEYEMPITEDLIKRVQTDNIGQRLQNRIERQSRLLGFIGQMLEKKISDEVRRYTETYKDEITKTGTVLLLEEELWELELCASHTYVAYPNPLDNIVFNTKTGKYECGEYFSLQVEYLWTNPQSKYTEIYADTVSDEEIHHYRGLLKKHCGAQSLNRVQIFRSDQPIITEYAIYDLDMEKLKRKHQTLHHLIADHVYNNNRLAVLMAPQTIADVNFVAQGDYFDYIVSHFDYLLKHSKEI